MLDFNAEEEVFFDTADYLSSEESVVDTEDLGCFELGYEVWMCEPHSVEERRESFIKDMGLRELGFDRLSDCSGAVSSSCALSSDSVEKSMVCSERNLDIEGNCMVDELREDLMDLSVALERKIVDGSGSAKKIEHRPIEAHMNENEEVSADQKKAKSLWKSFKTTFKRNLGTNVKSVIEKSKSSRLNVRQNNKKCKEFSAVYVGQEFQAHKGLIWTMKFSPDGKYLASGGEDGVVRIWRVTTACTSCKNCFIDCDGQGRKGKYNSGLRKSANTSVVIPDTDFQMEELPLQELYGHTNDILDLAWSNSNCLLSSSKDKTVRMWKVEHNECLGVFYHNNYVTCTQFNPVDENYFISGSIDGKVRIWGVAEKRVVDWADVREVITAICYHPNGTSFAVGSLSGICRFYDASGNDLLLAAEFHIHGRKRCSGNRITGIQFLEEDSQKVMVTSEDSKIRIFDGLDIVQKYRGLSKSGSQMSASLTSTGRHIISVGEDSHIYVWNYGNDYVPSKHPKSVRSCEHFFYEGVSVAIPWSNREINQSGCARPPCSSPKQDHQDSNSERFSLASWLFMDGSFRGTATWPEEKLPLWDVPAAEQDDESWRNHDHHNISQDSKYLTATWGLVIVTAGSDGMIRTFHNYGLPVRN
ncbi:Transducin/WD40 repeat-like superfamily protein [Heracleum sosnowskyi]|uniref:Transducin/WD40 repeat-like superfamily protein n=1 Tax=Heracleum sosnowskyi TaxID=360622 RepID=A0AAD8ND45_9APIA|nr:Transducin/WD40 repeat-like superfamily protein [Heracleum sosnowskyi]